MLGLIIDLGVFLEDKQALLALAESMKKRAVPVVFQRGDHVAVTTGELKGITGTIDRSDGQEAIVLIALEKADVDDDDGDSGDEATSQRAAKSTTRVHVRGPTAPPLSKTFRLTPRGRNPCTVSGKGQVPAVGAEQVHPSWRPR